MNADLILQIQEALREYLEPATLFEATLALLPKLGADFGSILLQTDANTLYFRSTLPGQEDLAGPAGRRFARRLLSGGLEGHVMRSGKPEILNDISADPRRYRADYLIDGCRGTAILPLNLAKTEARGVLVLGSARAGAFTPADLPLLEPAARQIGYAIESTLLFRNQRERATQLNLINEVSRAATSILNLNLMLTTVTQAIQRSFGFRGVGIYRLPPVGNTLDLAAFTGADGRSAPPRQVAPADAPFTAWVIQHGKTLVANDVKADKRYIPRPEDRGLKSKLVIPVKLGAKIIGALNLESTRLDAFDPPLVAALETLSDQLAVAIENARLYDDLSDTVTELMAFNRITQSVSASLDFQKTLTLVTEQVISMLNVAATSVALRDDETGEVWFAAASGEGSAAVLNRRMRLGAGIVGWVAQHGHPIIVPDVRQDSRFFPDMDRVSGFK
ncbi:MAG: GAF domain-containing protein, partial [Anaerolineae bacterium]